MHALVLQRLTPRVDTHIHKSSVRRHTTSSHVTRATSKAEALAELQALRQGVSQHLAATETALQAAAVSTPTTEALVEVTRPENDLHEISAAQFDELISTAGDAVVMVKFTSSKCGPCKLMLPKLVSMRDEYPNVHFVKIMMTTASKELGQRLNIRVAPSFLFYRDGQQVAFVTGTKETELRTVLDQHHS